MTFRPPPSMAADGLERQKTLRITGLFTLRRLRGSGYEKPQSALRAFVRFFSATFFCALKPCGFLYRAQKNVAYSRNVIRNFFCPKFVIAGGIRAA
ncbi:MAG: hypothetical protein LBH51_10245 [Treponema sp.]|nr:hypothetical protein [Treponema sp.]